MWNNFKHWLCRRFLPAWCEDELLEENARLRDRAEKQRQEIDRLNAYIDGMERAMKLQKRILIQGGERR